MNFLTQDAPVWLVLGFFLLSVLTVLLCITWVVDGEEKEADEDTWFGRRPE